MDCLRGNVVALVAFVWLFSTVLFHMRPQRTWIRAAKLTLVAFVWLFLDACFQMWPQIVCLRRGIVTLVASVWLFSTVFFLKCLLKLQVKRHSHIGCIYLAFLHCVFSYETSKSFDLIWFDLNLHWLHLFEFSPQPTAEEGFTIDSVSIQPGYRKDVIKIYGGVEH